MGAGKQKNGAAGDANRAGVTPFPKGIPQPALRALAAAGFTHLEQLEHAREKDLKTLHGMGPTALGLLQAALKERGKVFLN